MTLKRRTYKGVYSDIYPPKKTSAAAAAARIGHEVGVHVECCPGVADPYTLLGLLFLIAVATGFLRGLVPLTLDPPGKRTLMSSGLYFIAHHGKMVTMDIL